MKSANGDFAQLEISQLRDRISFRFSTGQMAYIIETESSEEARDVRRDLQLAALHIFDHCQDYYPIPAVKK